MIKVCKITDVTAQAVAKAIPDAAFLVVWFCSYTISAFLVTAVLFAF